MCPVESDSDASTCAGAGAGTGVCGGAAGGGSGDAGTCGGGGGGGGGCSGVLGDFTPNREAKPDSFELAPLPPGGASELAFWVGAAPGRGGSGGFVALCVGAAGVGGGTGRAGSDRVCVCPRSGCVGYGYKCFFVGISGGSEWG